MNIIVKESDLYLIYIYQLYYQNLLNQDNDLQKDLKTLVDLELNKYLLKMLDFLTLYYLHSKDSFIKIKTNRIT